MSAELESGVETVIFLSQFPFVSSSVISVLAALGFAMMFTLLLFNSRIENRSTRFSLWAIVAFILFFCLLAGIWKDPETASATLEEFESAFLDQYFITIVSASFMLIVSSVITRNFIPRRIGWVSALAALVGFFYLRSSGIPSEHFSPVLPLVFERVGVLLALVLPVLFLVFSERNRKQHPWAVWWGILILYFGVFYIGYGRMGELENAFSENLPFIMALILFAFAIVFASSATWTWVEWICALGLLFLALYSGIDRHEWGEVLFNGQLL